MKNIEQEQWGKIHKSINLIRSQIKWKPNKAEIHLQKRIDRKHLVDSATLKDYEKIILSIINNPEAKLYIYQYNDLIYPTIVSFYNDNRWLVMFSLDGVMETAFPPDNPTNYLSQIYFKYIGLLRKF
jgi:hypothetical protein